jgi:hypothetical protein
MIFTRRRRRSRDKAASSGNLVEAVAPPSVEVSPRYVRIGDTYAATMVVTGFPTEVGAGWLEPLLAWPGRLDVAIYVEPFHRQSQRNGYVGSGRNSNRPDARPQPAGSCPTRSPTPQPTTPQNSPNVSLAAPVGCSTRPCTAPCTPARRHSWSTPARK